MFYFTLPGGYPRPETRGLLAESFTTVGSMSPGLNFEGHCGFSFLKKVRSKNSRKSGNLGSPNMAILWGFSWPQLDPGEEISMEVPKNSLESGLLGPPVSLFRKFPSRRHQKVNQTCSGSIVPLWVQKDKQLRLSNKFYQGGSQFSHTEKKRNL